MSTARVAVYKLAQGGLLPEKFYIIKKDVSDGPQGHYAAAFFVVIRA